MALAYGSFHELSHQLRFLLFEAGVGITQPMIEQFITSAHQQCLYRLQQAALTEKLITQPLTSHHVQDFMEQMQRQLHNQEETVFYRWKSLSEELSETIANEAMALAYRHRWQYELAQSAQAHARFWDFLIANYSPGALLSFLEQWSCQGHPSHPNFRAKMGFSRREVLQYSPEFHAQVNIHWCALRHEHAKTSQLHKPYSLLLAEQFPGEYQLWREKLQFQQLNPEEFYPLPVHPWQWRNRIQKSFGELIDNKNLLLFPHHQLTRPSMSFRTMMPLADVSHLKLAVAAHTTSATRTVSPASIHNGPLLSSWLNGLLKKYDHYQKSLFLAHDEAGIHPETAGLSADNQKQLALIVRANPIKFINDDEQAVPLAALFSLSPLSNRPLLFDIINASQLSPKLFFSLYCKRVLEGQLHLMLGHGIAFEAHQQNTLIVFKEHRPQALIIRDLGGIYLCKSSSYQENEALNLHAASTIITNDQADLSNKFIHGNLQSNLTYWVKYLSQYYPLSAKELWRIVFDTLQNAFNTIKDVDPDIVRWQRQRILAEAWPYKCLLTMRLIRGLKNQTINALVPNPLAQFHD